MSQMPLEADIQELSPYPDSEVPAALARILRSPVLEAVRAQFFPRMAAEEFHAMVSAIRSTAEFQERVIAPAVDAMLAATSGGFSVSGVERNLADRKYVYISNHRDIICDSALFTYGLVRSTGQSPLICLGDNLLSSDWIKDLVKVNRGVTVKRGLSARELHRWAHSLSHLLNRSVRDRKLSVWIAQREGRAKDGDDRTHPGVLKMLTLSGAEESILDRIAALHIVPVSISYELDPCDGLKARELYLASQSPEGYRKQPGEDVMSMGLGIRGRKGRIHIEIGKDIEGAVERARKLTTRKEQLESVVSEIDRQIWRNYRLWPSNYIAADLLNPGDHRYRAHYSDQEKREFETRMTAQLQSAAGSLLSAAEPELRRIFLGIYARPVENGSRVTP